MYSDLYKIVIDLPVDKDIESVLWSYLSDKSFTHKYINNTTNLVIRRIIIENVNEQTINIIKNTFRNMYGNSNLKQYCSFHVLGLHEAI
jgi:hypothetical protein